MKDKLVYLIISLVGVAIIALIIGVVVSLSQPKEFTIKVIDPVSSVNPPSMTVKEGTKIKDLQVPVKDGYTFKYWIMDGEPLDPEMEITQDMSITPAYESKDVLITATQWLVTFENCDLESVKVADGGLLDKPKTPVKEGYKFVEWQKDGKKYDFSTVVTGDITLTAVWEKDKTTTNTNTNTNTNTTNTNTNSNTNTNTNTGNNNNQSNTYNITFVFNRDDAKYEYNGTTYDKNHVLHVQYSNEPNDHNDYIAIYIRPFKYDLDFVTSNDADVEKNGSNRFYIKTMNKQNVVINVNVKTTSQTVKVSFNTGGGTPSFPDQTITKGTTATNPGAPQKENATFVCWQYYGSCFDFNTVIDYNIQLNAAYSIDEVIL